MYKAHTVSAMITVGRQGFCSAVGSFPRIRLGSFSVSMRSAVFSLSSSPPPEKTNLFKDTHKGTAFFHDRFFGGAPNRFHKKNNKRFPWDAVLAESHHYCLLQFVVHHPGRVSSLVEYHPILSTPLVK